MAGPIDPLRFLRRGHLPRHGRRLGWTSNALRVPLRGRAEGEYLLVINNSSCDARADVQFTSIYASDEIVAAGSHSLEEFEPELARVCSGCSTHSASSH